jgi:hypothetical protein
MHRIRQQREMTTADNDGRPDVVHTIAALLVPRDQVIGCPAPCGPVSRARHEQARFLKYGVPQVAGLGDGERAAY